MNTYMKNGNTTVSSKYEEERYWFMCCQKNKYNEKTTSTEHGRIKISYCIGNSYWWVIRWF